VNAHEQGQLLPNRLLTQAEPLRPFRFYRQPSSGIAKYEKEHATEDPDELLDERAAVERWLAKHGEAHGSEARGRRLFPVSRFQFYRPGS